MKDVEPTREDFARIIRDAVNEIHRLRRENELLAAQVRVVDIFDRALSRTGGGYASPDAAYMLEQLAEHYEKQRGKKDD